VRIDKEGWGMAGEGSAALGAPELAGAMVNPRGFGKKASVGAIGGAVGRRQTSPPSAGSVTSRRVRPRWR
jgi:hypothetical protein